MAQMTVQVVTPDGLKYDHHASFIHAVTKDGQIGILPGHINLIAPLEVDELKVRRVDDESHVDWIAVNGGIIEVKDDLLLSLPIQQNVNATLTFLVPNVPSNVPNVTWKKQLNLTVLMKFNVLRLLSVEHLIVSVSVQNKTTKNETLVPFFIYRKRKHEK